MPSFRRGVAAALVLIAAGACTGGQPEPAPAPAPKAGAPKPPSAGQPGTEPRVRQDEPWPIKTRYVFDLWLHGYALLSDDSSRIPLFRTGYRDEMVVAKNKLRITTLLDTNHDSLADYLNSHAALAGGQFLALYENEWDEMQADIKVFLLANGDPHKAKDQLHQQMIATFAQSFPGAQDRHWLAMFSAALQDESLKFYQAYWKRTELARRPIIAAVDSLWTRAYARRLRRFQSSADQQRGDIYLSLPLGAEGRSILGGKRQNLIAVIYPNSADSAAQALYVIAHEAVGNVAAQVIGDNTTPVEKRNGTAERYLSTATVRGGGMLVQRVAPEQYRGYMAFYLEAAGIKYPAGQEEVAFRTNFELPDIILTAMRQAFDATTTGI